LLVEVHDHRALLARLVVVGDREDALEPVPVLVLEVEELPMAPEVLRLLRIRVADLLRVPEARARHTQVGELDERLPAEQPGVGLCGLRRVAEGRIFVDELLQLAVGEFVEPRLLAPLSVRRQRDRLRQIDWLLALQACGLRLESAGPARTAARTTAGRRRQRRWR